MSKLFTTTLRINLTKPEGRKAWAYLKNRDKSKYRSYSDAIIAAVNGYFDREKLLADDPYLETREKEDAFLQRLLVSPPCCKQHQSRHRTTRRLRMIWIQRWISSTVYKGKMILESLLTL